MPTIKTVDERFTEPFQLNGVDLDIAVAIIMKEWGKRYKKVFKIDFKFKSGDYKLIEDMIYKWGYDRTFITTVGAIRFYPEKWRNPEFKWLTVNQVYTWIGKKVWEMYLNKEFRVKVDRPKI